MLTMMKFSLWLAILALAKSDSSDTPELMEDMLVKYASSFEDLKDVPPPLLREALQKALPTMQERLVQMSMDMYANGRGAEGIKPNPLLIGFSMGLKRWSDYLSKITPLLSRAAASESYSERRTSSWCLYGGNVCYEDEEVHPCCKDNVSCSLSFIQYLLLE